MLENCRVGLRLAVCAEKKEEAVRLGQEGVEAAERAARLRGELQKRRKDCAQRFRLDTLRMERKRDALPGGADVHTDCHCRRAPLSSK